MRPRDYIFGRLHQRIVEMYGKPKALTDRTILGRVVFEERSYKNWAAWEYYYRLCKANDIYMVSENFIKEMDQYACSSHHKVRMFSVAYDVATDLNDFLLTI